jgi:F-box-like
MGGEVTENAILTIEGKIAETRAAFEYFTRTTRDVQDRLVRLEKQRNSLKNQIAPISSLPNELLGVIFEYGHLSSLRTRPPNEVVLSHVNQRFRDVAMNTRLLWTRIEVFVRTPFSKVIAYLQRSRTYPFDLFLDMDTDADWQLQPDSYLYTSPEWETIIHYMARCRTFSLRSNNSDVVDDIITFLQPVYAPVLRSLTIEYDNFGLDPELHRKIIEGGAPALTAVRMEGLGLYQCRTLSPGSPLLYYRD